MNINILNPSNYDKIFVNQSFEKKPEPHSDDFNKGMEYTGIHFEKPYTDSFFEKVTSNIGIIIQTALYVANSIIKIFVLLIVDLYYHGACAFKNLIKTEKDVSSPNKSSAQGLDDDEENPFTADPLEIWSQQPLSNSHPAATPKKTTAQKNPPLEHWLSQNNKPVVPTIHPTAPPPMPDDIFFEGFYDDEENPFAADRIEIWSQQPLSNSHPAATPKKTTAQKNPPLMTFHSHFLRERYNKPVVPTIHPTTPPPMPDEFFF
jgi:hypothetical protein